MKWKTELKEQFLNGMDCLRRWCRLPPWTSVGQMCLLVWFDVCACVHVCMCMCVYMCACLSVVGLGERGEQMSRCTTLMLSKCLEKHLPRVAFVWWAFFCASFLAGDCVCVCCLTHMKNLHDVITEMSSVTVRFVAQLSKGFNWVVSMLYLKNLWCELWQAQILNVGHFVLLPEHPCSAYKVIRHEH